MGYNIVKHRRGTTQEWLETDVIPEAGELIIEECSDGIRRCKIGDGSSCFSKLYYVDEVTQARLLKELESLRKDFESGLSDLNTALNTEVDRAALSIRKDVYNELRELTVDYKNNDTIIASRLQQKIDNVTSSLEKELEDIENTVDNVINPAIQQLDTRVATLQDSTAKAFISAEKSCQENLIKTRTELESADKALLDNISYLDKRGQEVSSDIKEQIGTLQQTLFNETRELTINIEDLRSTSNMAINENKEDLNSLTATIEDNRATTESQFEKISEAITANQNEIDTLLSELNTKLETTNGLINDTKNTLTLESKRIDNLISLEAGSTTGDAELIDIRSGYNGVDHESAGAAVRAIGHDLENLKKSLPDFIPANAVDGLLYEDNQLFLTSKGETVGDPVRITGGGGSSSASVVRVKNNLSSNYFTIAKDNEAWIDFTYTSFENEVPTGDGVYSITINNKKIDALSGGIQHNAAKRLNVSEYLKSGSNSVKVVCTDQYGSSKSLIYTISVVELRIESTFNSAQIFDDDITFRYKVFGQIEKTVYILVDGVEVSTKNLATSVNGNEITLLIPKQSHGCHKITAYITAVIGDNIVTSNTLEYEIACIEADNNMAIVTSIHNLKDAIQGDLISIPYMVYDPVRINSNIELIVYSQVAGELIEVTRTPIVVGREQQFWNTRKYPTGIAVFTISYTYDLYGVQTTITKSHTIKVAELEVDVLPEEDSMQLYLTAQGRSNSEQNPGIWTFTQASDGNKTYEPINTTFEGFNWKSNGWVTDVDGDTCLRLNGDAKAIINFRPFAEDFKLSGKTLEFEFAIRDVNDRDAIVIDCFDGIRGFRATPDTAFLRSSGTEVSCRYKDEERIRVAITVEHSDTTSRFVSIYLDGILSGVQRYATTDNFRQDNPLTIKLGSNLCGLDIYNIRIYDKALSTSAVLNNYIADQTVPTTRLQLMTDNDILDENGNVSYDRVKALGQIPIITFTGPMPTYKGDKKKKTTRMKFEDPAHPEMNFDVLLDQIDVQGTSSQFYIRKNWKVKLPEARAHMPGAIPAKVFCIKVDYAEATGTHNTGVANYVETFYDREEVTLPPQKDDTRIRTTIQGFPIIIFEKETEDSEPVFSSKGNFNYDKDAENAFGFVEDYKDFGVECWEFCNNTSDSVNFAGEIANDWLEDFEPRYVPKLANFERIEELKEIEELAASGKGIMTEAQRTELASLMSSCIANFKEMHDWVLSTATYHLVDGKRVPITPTALAEPVTYDETAYTEDNEEYRLAKFKYEFRNYFNMHYSSMYYVFTFFALMTDQRAKNMFLTRWKEDDGVYRWYPYFYDNDTIFGINNEGALVFDYFHEDTDQLGSSNVFNGQNSVLWNNFRLCFPQEIQTTYAKLRSDKKLTYSAIINQFVTEGSDKWSAAIYNADADYKYVSMARGHVDHTDEEGNQVTGIDASNLYQVRGPGEHHLRYFINNRINYCDSKWYAGNYPSDDIFLRIYTPKPADNATQEEIDRINASLATVPANPNITITPFSDMYAGVRYKSGTLQQERLKAGEPFTFKPLNENETFSDTETAIYGASEISSLGDLSGLYCGVINLSNATKLTALIIGNADPAYHNDNFREISVGSNRLLRYIDLRNCSGLGIAGENPQKTLELSSCPNIEHIYAEGTNLTSIDLPESGYIKTLHLPASINTLVIKNQQYLYPQSGKPDTDTFRDGLFVESYQNLRTLCIENCPNLNTSEILESCRDTEGNYTVERVRLTGIEWGTAEEPLANADFIKSLFPVYDEDGRLISGIRGIDEKNNPLDDAYLVGTCYIEKLTGADYAAIKAHYPYLDIKFREMTSNVIFKYCDIDNNEHTHTVSLTSKNSELGTCQNPELNPKPAWLENAAFTYEQVGWSRRQQISNGVHDHETDYKEFIQADALLNIAGDRVLYPVFKAIRKLYEVRFINPTANNNLLQSVMTPYGSDAIYTGETPTKQDTTSPASYEFTVWDPKPEKITGPMTCYAQFTLLDDKWYTIGIGDISDCVDYEGNKFDGYTLNHTNLTMTITECNNNFNVAVKVPDSLTFEDSAFKIVSIGGFVRHDKLELISLPNTLSEILARAFEACSNLSELTLPENLKTIGKSAFQGCAKIKEILIPASVLNIDEAAFADCTGLANIAVEEGNSRYIVLKDCLIDLNTKKLLQGLSTAEIPQNGTITSLGQYCFSNTAIETATIPEGINTVANNAFSHCTSLCDITLPNTLKILDATCFAWCSNLREIALPEGLVDIRTYVFDSCSLENVIIPASVENILERAFGDMPSLTTVTFEKCLDADGNVRVPFIHKNAFAGCTNHITFYVPWSESYDYNYIEKVKDAEGNDVEIKINPVGWGALDYEIIYESTGGDLID